MQNIIIYREPGHFAGWPANYGIWHWEDEIVVGFTVGRMNLAGGFHARDMSRPFMPMQARSPDGGASWAGYTDALFRSGRPRSLSGRAYACRASDRPPTRRRKQNPIGTRRCRLHPPRFCAAVRRTGLNAGAISWFYTSTDRCHSWQGPYQLPDFGQTGIAARTDYLVDGPRQCKLFLTAAKADGLEGRIFCAETTDGGSNFSLLSFVGPEPRGFGDYACDCPSD